MNFQQKEHLANYVRKIEENRKFKNISDLFKDNNRAMKAFQVRRNAEIQRVS